MSDPQSQFSPSVQYFSKADTAVEAVKKFAAVQADNSEEEVRTSWLQ